ncbi:hypothetical protein Pmani_013948 [Petrolisthes manimaculis]|uniref:Uncharacterized protein n=1 Tax=Petrolisthes manimaculis TaxID=1843537 RepID=A0AAE1PUM1_9EUCA|nr:hypothetical protein Pmani_013948 [Petrolisthes manimaculis]
MKTDERKKREGKRERDEGMERGGEGRERGGRERDGDDFAVQDLGTKINNDVFVLCCREEVKQGGREDKMMLTNCKKEEKNKRMVGKGGMEENWERKVSGKGKRRDRKGG